MMKIKHWTAVLLTIAALSAGCRKDAPLPNAAPTENETNPAAESTFADLESRGAVFVFEKEGKLKSADFTAVSQSAAFSPDEISLWKSLRVLRGKGVFSDTLAKQIPSCSALTECLWLDTDISPDGLKSLSGAEKLKKLRMTGLTADPDDLRPLQAFPALVELDLSGASLSDEAMGIVAGLPALTRLNLYQNKIGNEGVKNLLPLADQLVWLNLDDTRITDEVGPILGQFGKLKFLHLGRTKITDEIVGSLARLKSLETVHVTRTGITEEGAARLREALPNTEVISVVKEMKKETP